MFRFLPLRGSAAETERLLGTVTDGRSLLGDELVGAPPVDDVGGGGPRWSGGVVRLIDHLLTYALRSASRVAVPFDWSRMAWPGSWDAGILRLVASTSLTA